MFRFKLGQVRRWTQQRPSSILRACAIAPMLPGRESAETLQSVMSRTGIRFTVTSLTF